MTVEHLTAESRLCRCGCGRDFRLFTGMLKYDEDALVAFRIGHLAHCESAPHLWLLLGSGPWFDDDPRGCWLVLHTWITERESVRGLTARVEEPEESPFSESDCFDERLLTRAEVLSRDGALEWAVARRNGILDAHIESKNFMFGAEGGSSYSNIGYWLLGKVVTRQ